MICPTCRTYKAMPGFCMDDGTKLMEFNCVCGNSLTLNQKYCETCGAKCPTFSQSEPNTVNLTEANHA